MKLFKEIAPIKQFLTSKRAQKLRIGFVPTMGALHNGHLSLIKKAKSDNDIVVCSIFVNPTQFNNADDLAKYPRPIENDIKILLENGCDVLFYPEVSEMYADNETVAAQNYGFVTQTLEGYFRPGHFDGVLTIVKKLFDVVEPNNAYFGQKDYQQCAVVNQLIKRNNIPVQLQICPTLREPDGLAMSSRNVRLTAEERTIAAAIPQALFMIKDSFRHQSVEELKSAALIHLSQTSPLLKVEYLEIVDFMTLEPLSTISVNTKAVALAAVWCGNVRLIDNMILSD